MIQDLGLNSYKGLSKDVKQDIENQYSQSFITFIGTLVVFGSLGFYAFMKFKN